MQLLGICSVAAHTWHGKLCPRMKLAWKWQWPLTSLSHSPWGRIPRRKTNGWWTKGKGGGQETGSEVVAVSQERGDGGWHPRASCGTLGRWIDFGYVLNIGQMGFADGIKIRCRSRITLRFVAWITGRMKSIGRVFLKACRRKTEEGRMWKRKVALSGNSCQFSFCWQSLSVITSLIYHWTFSKAFE